jgi:isopenicillin-N epimerase
MDNKFENHNFKDLWDLNPEYKYLNHGAFGACPKFILNKQNEYRKELEKQPVEFMIRTLEPLWLESQKKLASFLNADPLDIVFVPCATNGVNTVLKSIDFKEGDEILTTDHEYFACKNAADYIERRYGVKVIIAKVPFPIADGKVIPEILMSQVTENTKLLLIDYISSPTGMVFPVPEIINEFNKLGIDTLIDGAHAPGMIPLNLSDLGATYFTGNCHKWVCSPKGSAFLYVKKEKQQDIHPLSYSHTYNAQQENSWNPFQTEFYWSGTYDPSPYLCIGDSIDYMAKLLPGGWEEVMKRNNNLVLKARKIICEKLDIPLPCPESMIGSIASFPISESNYKGKMCRNFIDPLQDVLFSEYKIEVPVSYWDVFPKRVMRISSQLYNNIEEYNDLGLILKNIINDRRV